MGDLAIGIRQTHPHPAKPWEGCHAQGRIGLAQSLLFREVGRALLQPLTQQQYSKRPARSRPVTLDLGDTTRWRLVVRGCEPPREIPHWSIAPALAYIDACGAGHIAAILIVGGARHVAGDHLPARCAHFGEPISEF